MLLEYLSKGAAAAGLAVLTFAICQAEETRGSFSFGYPEPRQIAAERGVAALPKEFSVSAPPQLSPAISDLNELLSARGLKLRHVGGAKAFLRLELATEGTPEHPQGYLIEIGAERIVISSRTPEGLFNGLQTLRMMMLEAKGTELPLCRIVDQPTLERRGIAFSIHGMPRRRFVTLKKLLRTLAALKYNRVLIEFGDNFPFASPRPGASRENLTAAEVAELLKFASDRFIEVVPMLRVWSYCPPVADRGDDRLLEEPHNGKDSPYCPLKPALSALLKSVIGEQCALIRPRNYAFCFDRRGLRQGFRQCRDCRNMSPEALVSGHLRMLENECAASGVNADFIFDRFDRLPDLSKMGLPPRSRSIFVGIPRPGMPGASSIGREKSVGAAVRATVAAGGREFTMLCFDSADNGRLVPIRNASPWFFGGVVDAASALWSPDRAAVPEDPTALFFRIFDSIPAEADFTAVPVPLDKVLNAELSRCEHFPQYRGDELEKLRKALAERPEKFRLTTFSGGRYYGVLLSGTSNDRLRSAPVTIDLGGFRAPTLELLLGCNPPLQQAKYDPSIRGGKLYEYEELATVTLDYANGKKVVRPLRYMVDITDWNRRFGGYSLHLVHSGADAKGRLVNWWACRLKNPHPDWPLGSLTFGTCKRGGMAPVLLAVSLLDASGGKFPPNSPEKRLSDLDTGADGFLKMPAIVTMDFEDQKLAPASLNVKNAEFGKGAAPEVSFPVDTSSPSRSRALMIRIPAAKSSGGDIKVSLDIPGTQRGAVRSLGFACRIDHPEYLSRAYQELGDTYSKGTYRQRFFPEKTWRSIWTAFGNPDYYSRVKLRDPHRSNLRRIVFCFRELPEPVTIWIDDIAQSRWERHTMPRIRAD